MNNVHEKSIENGQICNQMMMRERLERFGEVWIIDEADGFRLDFVKKIQGGFSRTTPNMGAVLQKRTNLRLVYSQQLRRREKLRTQKRKPSF